MNSKLIALISLLAALYLIVTLLPGIPVPGLPRLKIQLEAGIATVYGALLGPIWGAVATAVGVILATYLPPGGASLVSIVFSPSPVFNALISGLLYKGLRKQAFLILSVAIIIISVSPIFHPLSKYSYIYFAALYDKVITLFLILTLPYLETRNRMIYLIVLGFIGSESDNIMGNVIFSNPYIYKGVFGLNEKIARKLYLISPLFYPFVRLLQGVFSAIVIYGLEKRLPKDYWISKS